MGMCTLSTCLNARKGSENAHRASDRSGLVGSAGTGSCYSAGTGGELITPSRSTIYQLQFINHNNIMSKVFFFSWKTITKVGKDLPDHVVQLSNYHQYFRTKPCPSVQHLNVSWTPPEWWGYHLPGQPDPAPDQSFREEIFPDIQPESPLAQLQAIPSSPITVTWEKKLMPTLTHPPFRSS